MPTYREILEACADWSTVEEIQRRAGGTRGNIRSARARLAEKGCIESRFVDGVGFQYRAKAPAAPGRDRHVQDAVLRALEGGPKDIRQIVGETGCLRVSCYQALRALTSKGRVVRTGECRFTWRLAP